MGEKGAQRMTGAHYDVLCGARLGQSLISYFFMNIPLCLVLLNTIKKRLKLDNENALFRVK